MDKEWFKTVVRLYLRQNTKKENLAYKEKKVFGRSISEKTTSSLQKYISNFPYFTGFPACALVKRYVFSLIFALMR